MAGGLQDIERCWTWGSSIHIMGGGSWREVVDDSPGGPPTIRFACGALRMRVILLQAYKQSGGYDCAKSK